VFIPLRARISVAVLEKRNQLEDAIALQENLLRSCSPALDIIDYRREERRLVTLLRKAGSLPRVEAVLRSGLERRSHDILETHPELGYAMADLAIVLMELSKFDEAEELFKQAQDKLLNHAVVPDYRKHELCTNIVNLYEQLQQPERVEEWRQKSSTFSTE
jgi:tetratricopeptide (TPR) repeat protein